MPIFLGIPDQRALFTGCKWDLKTNRILVKMGTETLSLNKARFDIVFGGRFIFVLDNNNERTTNSAWNACVNLRNL